MTMERRMVKMTLKLITQQLISSSSVSGPDKAVLIASKKKCKCGSTTHLRTIVTESGDPMNKNKRRLNR